MVSVAPLRVGFQNPFPSMGNRVPGELPPRVLISQSPSLIVLREPGTVIRFFLGVSLKGELIIFILFFVVELLE